MSIFEAKIVYLRERVEGIYAKSKTTLYTWTCLAYNTSLPQEGISPEIF
jgi:hypothetical protein